VKKIINLYNEHPIIYFRYYQDKLMYIGESQSLLSGRAWRQDDRAGKYDKIIYIKASKEKLRRMYWEAYLICKLKPHTQMGYINNYKSYMCKGKNKDNLNLFKKNMIIEQIKTNDKEILERGLRTSLQLIMSGKERMKKGFSIYKIYTEVKEKYGSTKKIN